MSQRLDTDLRKQLLKLSFVAGFLLANGIARELAGEWYSFEKEEEQRAGKP